MKIEIKYTDYWNNPKKSIVSLPLAIEKASEDSYYINISERENVHIRDVDLISPAIPKSYNDRLAKVETYIQKGFSNLTESEENELEMLTREVAAMEEIIYPMPMEEGTPYMVEGITITPLIKKYE